MLCKGNSIESDHHYSLHNVTNEETQAVHNNAFLETYISLLKRSRDDWQRGMAAPYISRSNLSQ